MAEGMSWFGGVYTFEGLERWQLWFDSPNKAAAFIAEIAIACIAIALCRRHWLRVAGLLLASISTFALVRTFSRGGVMALLSSAVVIAWPLRQFGLRSWKSAVLLAVVATAAVSSLVFGFDSRMAHGFSGEDKSATNRLVLWSAVPQMMHDAPCGWGLGNSGNAYMDWYQPLDRDERYRTLVNSHLTWMAETGWPGLVVWAVGWLALLHFACMTNKSTGRWICLAEWVCFFVAGIFSSVMESLWLWLIPVGLLLAEAAALRKEFAGRIASSLRFGFAWGVFVAAGLYLIALLASVESRIDKRGKVTSFIGQGGECWIVADDSVLGGPHYPRILREIAEYGETVTFHIVNDVLSLPKSVATTVFCGGVEANGRRGCRNTIWISPIGSPDIMAGDVVVCGEFSDIVRDVEGVDVLEVSGAGKFIPEWPEIISRIVLEQPIMPRPQSPR